MKQLVEAYKPLAIDGFVGLAKPKAILRRVADTPYESAWLFLGPSGTGKTTMALAFADTVGAEVHHIASKACDLETVNEVVRKCWYQPMFNAWHVVIVDEADQMSKPAQLAFLSKLDTTAMPPKTIFVFTANDTKALEDRFLSRVRTLTFDHPPVAETALLLHGIWQNEAKGKPGPNYFGILDDAAGNVRRALMSLEMDLMVA